MIKILQHCQLIVRTYLANILACCLRWLKLIFGQQLILIAFLTVLIYSYSPATVFAVKDLGAKSIENNDGDGCINGTHCHVERYSTPGEKTKALFGGDDWEVTNPVCISSIASQVALGLGLSLLTDIACTNQVLPTTAAATPLAASGVGIIATLFSSLFSNISVCITKAATGDVTCCVFCADLLASLTALVTVNGTLMGLSLDRAKDDTMCGNKWWSWSNKENNKDKTCRNGAYEGSYQKELQDCFLYKTSNSCGEEKITNSKYREHLYGGVEYEDNRSDSCKNPTNWDSAKRMAKLGYNGDNQRYYFTGPRKIPAFACHRFYSSDKTDAEATEAYNCCEKATQNLTCIEQGSIKIGKSYTTCAVGKKCAMGGISYEVQKNTKADHICASTYSLCPFNSNLGDGTEKKAYKDNGTNSLNTTSLTNYCQHLKHCTKIPSKPYINPLASPDSFVSQSCRDMQGDSQNIYPFAVKYLKGSNFSAPLVQCFKETVENIFFNRVGYSKCLDADEEAIKDVCKSGYQFKKGDPLTKDSVFVKISNSFRDIVRVMLALSVVFMGIRILLGTQPEKKLLLLYVAKIGLIIYFVLGDAWQTMFMKGVFALSETMTDITMQIKESDDLTKLDGCQFPRFNYLQEDDVANPKYPPGKEYLRVWDILDCKLAKAIGFGPSVTIPNLIKIILPALFSSFLAVGGIFFVVAVVFFALLFFSIVTRAAQISITSTIAIVLLVYISPLAIVAGFFDKTKEAFNSWLSQLLGMALQPMIVFAYIGLFITVFDRVVVGEDVSFTRSGRDPAVIKCGEQAKKTSVYCMFDFVKFAESVDDSSASAMLGLPGFWILEDALGDSFDKSIQLFKSLLILFVFFNAFDHIPSLAVALVGGVRINAKNEIDSMGIAKKVGGGMFSVAKLASFASGKAFNKVKGAVGQMRTPLSKDGSDSKKDALDSLSKDGSDSKKDALDSKSNLGSDSKSESKGDSLVGSKGSSDEGDSQKGGGSGSRSGKEDTGQKKGDSSGDGKGDNSSQSSSGGESREGEAQPESSEGGEQQAPSAGGNVPVDGGLEAPSASSEFKPVAPPESGSDNPTGPASSNSQEQQPTTQKEEEQKADGNQNSNPPSRTQLGRGKIIVPMDEDNGSQEVDVDNQGVDVNDSLLKDGKQEADPADSKTDSEEDLENENNDSSGDGQGEVGEDEGSSDSDEEGVKEDEESSDSKGEDEEEPAVDEELKSEEEELKPNEQDAINQNSEQVEAPKQNLNKPSNSKKPAKAEPAQAKYDKSSENFNLTYVRKNSFNQDFLDYVQGKKVKSDFLEIKNDYMRIAKGEKAGDRSIAVTNLRQINSIVNNYQSMLRKNQEKRRLESLITRPDEFDSFKKNNK